MANGEDREAVSTGGTFEEELQKMEKEQSEAVDLEARERELEELQKRAREIAGELWAARAAKRRRAAEAALPVIQPREPCGSAWEAMKGGTQVRTCGKCKQHVYDLGALAPEDARKLLTDKEGKLPTHVIGRVDGTVTTTHCAEKKARMSPLAIGLAAFGAVGLLMSGMGIGWAMAPGDSERPIIEVSVAKAATMAAQAPEARPDPPEPPKPPAIDERERERDERAERRERALERRERQRCRQHHDGLWFFLGSGFMEPDSCGGDEDDDEDVF